MKTGKFVAGGLAALIVLESAHHLTYDKPPEVHPEQPIGILKENHSYRIQVDSGSTGTMGLQRRATISGYDQSLLAKYPWLLCGGKPSQDS